MALEHVPFQKELEEVLMWLLDRSEAEGQLLLGMVKDHPACGEFEQYAEDAGAEPGYRVGQEGCDWCAEVEDFQLFLKTKKQTEWSAVENLNAALELQKPHALEERLAVSSVR